MPHLLIPYSTLRSTTNDEYMMQLLKTPERRRIGSGFIEAVLVGMVLILIALAAVDLFAFVSAVSLNDGAAKIAARAAANQSNQNDATAAAQQALADYQSNGLASISLKACTWNQDRVVVQTSVEVHLPVPCPNLGDKPMVSQDTEPVLAVPPSDQ